MVNRNRFQIERSFSCDVDKLYDSLDTAIEYLQEVKKDHPDACLDEHWTGYEDMTLRFVWMSEETDDEYFSRVEREEYRERLEKEMEDSDRRKEKTRIAKEMKKLKDQLKKL